jgi:hypothetical protein
MDQDGDENLAVKRNESAVDICWSGDRFLPPAEPAPKPQARSGSKLTDGLAHVVAALVVELCFERAGRSFSVRELWDRVPGPKPPYRALNGVGDYLGHGKGERSLKLWKGAHGPLCCRENAIIAVRRLGLVETQELASRLKLTEPSALWQAICDLPSAAQCTDH